ncbi:MAG: peptidase M4 [Oxalobacteraceae bacterium]|nr:MAG: peptidase M4 [Oxalobacteraceae bacterium]
MKITFTAALVGLAALTATAAVANGPAKPTAKLSMAQARAIALKNAPGKVVESDYENEKGGWRYSFDIRQGRRIHEIGVDANSGRIVEDAYESAKDKD